MKAAESCRLPAIEKDSPNAWIIFTQEDKFRKIRRHTRSTLSWTRAKFDAPKPNLRPKGQRQAPPLWLQAREPRPKARRLPRPSQTAPPSAGGILGARQGVWQAQNMWNNSFIPLKARAPTGILANIKGSKGSKERTGCHRGLPCSTWSIKGSSLKGPCKCKLIHGYRLPELS